MLVRGDVKRFSIMPAVLHAVLRYKEASHHSVICRTVAPAGLTRRRNRCLLFQGIDERLRYGFPRHRDLQYIRGLVSVSPRELAV